MSFSSAVCRLPIQPLRSGQVVSQETKLPNGRLSSRDEASSAPETGAAIIAWGLVLSQQSLGMRSGVAGRAAFLLGGGR